MFDNEIAAQQRIHIQCNFGSKGVSEIAGNLQKVWPRQTGKKEKTKLTRSRIRGQETKEVMETKKVAEAMKDKRR